MYVNDFDFHLPPELIALHPALERDGSRLMFLDRQTKSFDESSFKGIATHLIPGDLLVMNDTRVIPARLLGHKESGGKVEIFLLRRDGVESKRWICMIRSSKRVPDGHVIQLAAGMLASVCCPLDAETWIVEFEGLEPFDAWLEREGHIPLPPYLQRTDQAQDRERYQTVYAKESGAVAAPTAGLHFTQELLTQLELQGIAIAFLTLHVGLGTFKPIRVERVEDHQIHTERYSISELTAGLIHTTKKRGGRIVAVGTTTARTLEFAADAEGYIKAGEGEANIFIYPGYKFKVVDALVTNFHLPKSTLLMLVSAFAGKEFIDEAYRMAVKRGYQFYSYGDAMFIQ